MKHIFKVCYELDTPIAIAVAVYLDSEHYIYLHEDLSSSIEIIEKGSDYYKCHQTWKVLGLRIGQSYTCRYLPPATFINMDLKPFPFWLPSVHHFIKTKTTLRYYENPSSKTTLSELTVELDLPFWLYPLRKKIQQVIEKIKILKDLEDVALVDRRAKLFGRNNNSVYLKKHQFMLHKKEYEEFFAENCRYLGNPTEIEREERWTNIKNLDLPYVEDFLKHEYIKYTNFEPALAGALS